VLAADHGHPSLVLRWDIWGTESLDWVGENHFSGSTRFGPFEFVREPAATDANASGRPGISHLEPRRFVAPGQPGRLRESSRR
jgi:hypothetical protein